MNDHKLGHQVTLAQAQPCHLTIAVITYQPSNFITRIKVHGGMSYALLHTIPGNILLPGNFNGQ